MPAVANTNIAEQDQNTDPSNKLGQETSKTTQILGTEYHYRGKDKRILVRIIGDVKPSTAKRFEPVAANS